MKRSPFLGNSLKQIRAFGEDARFKVGYELEKVQLGEQPSDSKPMKTVGRGVEEIRVWADDGTYRVIYTAKLAEMVYVLHAFQKKTQVTSKSDIELARTRLKALMKEMR